MKRIFRNCWIIGRRFRLAHVKFGTKTIEVATFRRQVPPDQAAPETAGQQPAQSGARRPPPRRDNTFGTAEEDAFRRDFTINALFYDIATFSVIDYVGGLEDLGNRVIRSIGDPRERFVEDPVRMLRAVSFAERLDFRLDPPVADAIAEHRAEIANASSARMIEELYKILRSGVSARIVRALVDLGLMAHIAPEIERDAAPALWQSLAALDGFRRRFDDAPASLTNAVLLGSLAAPVQDIDLTPRRKDDPKRTEGDVQAGRAARGAPRHGPPAATAGAAAQADRPAAAAPPAADGAAPRRLRRRAHLAGDARRRPAGARPLARPGGRRRT